MSGVRFVGPLLTLFLVAGVLACTEGAAEARAHIAACDDGDAQACHDFGVQLVRGRQVLTDWRRASELFQEACDGGVPEGCSRRGWLYLHFRADDRGLRIDSALATDLYERACDEGATSGCVALAELYLQKDSVVPDVEPTGPLQDLNLAAELYGRACDAGDVSGCIGLGVLHRDSVGVGANPVLAAQLFQRACSEGAQLGCAYLGHALETGSGLPRDQTRAATLFEESCEAEELMGCFYLGGLLERGVVLEQDYEAAVDHYEDACLGNARRDEGSRGVGESCFRAAELTAMGAAGEGQRYRSIRFYRRACQLGYDDACEHEG